MAKKRAKKPRVLVINNESRYMADLRRTVNNHAKGKAEVDTAHVSEAKSKLKDMPEAVILSGSHKRRYDNPEVQAIIEHIDTYNKENPDSQVQVYGACLGHQALVHYHGGKIEDLGRYQKGNKEIELKDGRKVKVHKHHRHGVTDAGGLEVIAESTVQDAQGKGVRIVEAVKHKSKPYTASQGHPEREGHAQDMLYDFLNSVYKKKRHKMAV